ncbi:MAG: hypothetical protein IT457_24345 [Planctomycetes bacterium]|nr:hypothetical protein [Planctomycetota bacterium]
MSERQQSAVADALEVAASVAGGGACLLRACRRIVALQHCLGPVPQDILDPIRAVESELDDVPEEVDAPRWQSEAFEQKLLKRDDYLERVRPLLLECFRELREYLASGFRSDIQS